MDLVKNLKSNLRRQIKTILNELAQSEKEAQTEIVLNKLFQLDDYKKSKRVSVYLSTKNEIGTEKILKNLFDSGKSCFVPRYDGNNMDMVKLHSMDDYDRLPVTKWDIKQPDLQEKRENALDSGGLDLIIVPGVAFSLEGYRLGHGKGYYDKFLHKYFDVMKTKPKTVALAFKEQIVNEIPINQTDQRLDLILVPE